MEEIAPSSALHRNEVSQPHCRIYGKVQKNHHQNIPEKDPMQFHADELTVSPHIEAFWPCSLVAVVHQYLDKGVDVQLLVKLRYFASSRVAAN